MRFALMLLFVATPAAARQGALLRYTPSVGQVSAYRIAMTSEMDLPTGSHVSVEQVMHVTHRVTAKRGDVSTVEFVIDSASMTSPGMPGSVSERLAGTRATILIDSRGRVLDVRYADTLLQRATAGFIMGSLPGGSPGQILFAERPVMPGTAWSDTGTTTAATDQGRLSLRRDFAYRLERLEARGRARVAVISVTGTTRQTLTLGDGDGTATMTSESTMRGQVAYDLEASRWAGYDLVMMMATESVSLTSPLEVTITVQGGLVGKD